MIERSCDRESKCVVKPWAIYLRGALNQGLCNALTHMVTWRHNPFLLQEKWNNWKFQCLGDFRRGRNFWVSASFWRTFSLQRPLEKFLEVADICFTYLMGALSSGLYNALTLAVTWPLNHFLWQEKWSLSKFEVSEPWKQVEISEFLSL